MTTAYVTAEDQIVAYDPGEHTLEDNFNRFHSENPHVYETLVRLALDWRLKRPGQQCGIGMLYEVARWELDLRGEGEPVALNNNYRAFYARMLMDCEADLDGLFETRRQRGLDAGGNGVACPPSPPASSPADVTESPIPRDRLSVALGSPSGGAGGLAAASAARTAEAPAPSEQNETLGARGKPGRSSVTQSARSQEGYGRNSPASPAPLSAVSEDAAAGSPKQTPPAAATLFDLPAEPDWA